MKYLLYCEFLYTKYEYSIITETFATLSVGFQQRFFEYKVMIYKVFIIQDE